MTTPAYSSDPVLLFSQLEAAIHAGDRSRIEALWAEFQRALLLKQQELAALERRARELLAAPEPPTTPGISVADRLDRGLASNDAWLRHLELMPRPASGTPTTEPEGTLFPVWFGTNREPLVHADGTLAGFGNERASRTTLGRTEVFIPEAHRFGETGSSFWQRLKRLDLRDDRLRLKNMNSTDPLAFFAGLRADMEAARAAGSAPHALVFIHGFNVSFEQAAIRAAQIGCDLKVPGATAFFSWPSRGTVAAYPADEATIEASEAAITRFLVDFHDQCGAERIHLIAHSMGNRGLLRALQRITANARTAGRIRFGQIFLAAPDVDRDLFRDLADVYTRCSDRTTLYTSGADLAVHVSHRLHDAPRAGYFDPFTVVDGIDTVAVPDFDLDLLGHSYFAQAEALLHDIYDLMRNNQPPAHRQRLRPRIKPDGSIWQLAL